MKCFLSWGCRWVLVIKHKIGNLFLFVCFGRLYFERVFLSFFIIYLSVFCICCFTFQEFFYVATGKKLISICELIWNLGCIFNIISAIVF